MKATIDENVNSDHIQGKRQERDYIRKDTTKQIVGYGFQGRPIFEPVTIETLLEECIRDNVDEYDKPMYSTRVMKHLTDATHALRMVTTLMTPAQRDVFECRWCDALESSTTAVERISLMADAISLALEPVIAD